MIDPTQPEFDQPSDEPVTANLETVNVAEPRDVQKRTRQQRTEQQDSDEFWQMILASPRGRTEMWTILKSFGTFEHRLGVGPGGFPQPDLTQFNMGRKSAGEELYLRWMGIDREALMLMLTENEPSLKAALAAKLPTRRRAQKPQPST